MILNPTAASAIGFLLYSGALPGPVEIITPAVRVNIDATGIYVTGRAVEAENYESIQDFGRAYGVAVPPPAPAKPDAMDAGHERNSKAPLMLYALMSAVPGPLRMIHSHDWSQFGLTSDEFEAWWEVSQAAMLERQQQLAARARAKLSADELRALGLRP